MDNSVMGAGLLSGSTSGILELEPSIQRHQQSHSVSHHHHLQAMNSLTGLNGDHSMGFMEAKSTAPKGMPMNCSKGKGFTKAGVATSAAANNNSSNTSDEDEPSYNEDGNDPHFNGARGKKGSPWQRMKWTDNVVRLLIAVVSFVGDDVTPEGVDGLKRKSGVLQKKGKWKTVSNIMMEKGCYVSPQQCEDKFNDLNKRYKRLNEILGRGTTCRVVENPALLDTMTNITAKMKDDVRKILSSKHLFYKEMCAYHNGQRIPNTHDFDLHSLPATRCSEGNGFEGEEDVENEDCDDGDSDDEDDNNAEEDAERMGEFGKRRENEEDGNLWLQSGIYNSFAAEIAGVLQDPTKSTWERREWIRNQLLQLQVKRVNLQAEAFELEKRHLKWLRFCNKKDRELELLRLNNERMRLENERMTLQVKQIELELDFKRSEASLNPVSLGIDRRQGGRDQIESGRVQ
ncbi:PREDICTED: uncharacterized protein LOC104590097 [Nelumbo nucifera]|uniref:Uncharacterized protein LOC104590097 n=2 Tax=Nelumbo nucifera TaxID=4432 RepID=A0A1U7Z7L8_NELNU|nr:PREDICTED: uncharacterized protein LOC104590097 [Nelumbo nucifera]XP_010246932.1 PREDICTED: uncharacterized protein LOC104590097 [Nelumbo nucifera]XP_010246933.1 PREDICTED: uncharacterized protein LOC104590097 [Nelumbo nucifera]DAD29827.1 TPA_asm: hypothetical protein HUJ06_031295 [Nelumbo nucifera]